MKRRQTVRLRLNRMNQPHASIKTRKVVIALCTALSSVFQLFSPFSPPHTTSSFDMYLLGLTGKTFLALEPTLSWSTSQGWHCDLSTAILLAFAFLSDTAHAWCSSTNDPSIMLVDGQSYTVDFNTDGGIVSRWTDSIYLASDPQGNKRHEVELESQAMHFINGPKIGKDYVFVIEWVNPPAHSAKVSYVALRGPGDCRMDWRGVKKEDISLVTTRLLRRLNWSQDLLSIMCMTIVVSVISQCWESVRMLIVTRCY